MPRQLATAAAAVALCLAAACSGGRQADLAVGDDVDASPNPLVAPWTGPYGGVPAFDLVELADFESALAAAMAENLREIEAIASSPEPPSFDNTIVALERSGRTLDRVETYLGVWRSNRSSPEFREIFGRIAPRLSEHRSKIVQNDELFRRVASVHAAVESAEAGGELPADRRRLVELIYDGFARNGATLEGGARERYAEIQQELANLQTRFANHVLADEEKYVLYLQDDQLAGLPQSFVDAAAAAAAERGQEGRYAVLNTRSSADPFLTYSAERDLRETVWRTFTNRGDNGDENDNNRIISEILRLRHERVGLLGYDNYAQWRLEDRMAKTPERALELLEAVWPAALARVEEEVAAMREIAEAEGGAITIEPWDYSYYAEKVRQARYDLDSDEVSQYLQLDRLREAMFYVAGELFGFDFTAVPEDAVPVFHPDVRVWEVTDRRSGDHVGLWYLDPFARVGKRSGAWASGYRDHTTFDSPQTVLVSNNSNFIRPAPGEPVLVSWRDAETLFHEFGHALHRLASNVAYPTLNGGVRDYTEFQSQLLERWLLTEPVVDRYLVHQRTGEPIPDELVAKIERAETFNEGFRTTEYLASALVDLAFHTTDPADLDPDAFERQTLARLGMPDEIAMRHRPPHFGHIFSSEGYSAGYYGYLWADVLTSDAAEAFAQAPGGFYDGPLAAKLVEHLFAVRNAVDPDEAYRSFRGRAARIDALMRDRGFPVAGPGA